MSSPSIHNHGYPVEFSVGWIDYFVNLVIFFWFTSFSHGTPLNINFVASLWLCILSQLHVVSTKILGYLAQVVLSDIFHFLYGVLFLIYTYFLFFT